MKIYLLIFLFSFPIFAKNIMILGDSHAVGPFGKSLHKNLSKNISDNIALYAHSSSAASHWVSSKRYKLFGGVEHRLTVDGKIYKKNIHYKIRHEVPYIENILEQLVFNDDWRREVGNISPIDVVVVALGANDLQAVSTIRGTIKKSSYNFRKKAISKMIDHIESIGAKCLWIGPPDGSSSHHSKARQKTLYKFLRDSLGDRCKLFSSNRYKVKGCDKIHFSCREERRNARKWANQATKFINKNM